MAEPCDRAVAPCHRRNLDRGRPLRGAGWGKTAARRADDKGRFAERRQEARCVLGRGPRRDQTAARDGQQKKASQSQPDARNAK
ncbi:hypothetical protein GCM10023209_01750 [Roseibacterium beibuensis]|uniref:Uncharacterized protein n=1 Tax=[Roseibacterium] beibuensis TaxID=1193142 RepID=A0ABP9KS64_9RHOB